LDGKGRGENLATARPQDQHNPDRKSRTAFAKPPQSEAAAGVQRSRRRGVETMRTPPRSTHRFACGLLVLAASVWLGGCQGMDRRELTWQTLHAIDVAQTLNAASDPCYEEKAWLTQRLIGAQPSDAE